MICLFTDIFNDTVSRLQLGLMVDVVGILRHYLNTHVQDCTVEPATNSSMTSEDFKLVIRNAVIVNFALIAYLLGENQF